MLSYVGSILPSASTHPGHVLLTASANCSGLRSPQLARNQQQRTDGHPDGASLSHGQHETPWSDSEAEHAQARLRRPEGENWEALGEDSTAQTIGEEIRDLCELCLQARARSRSPGLALDGRITNLPGAVTDCTQVRVALGNASCEAAAPRGATAECSALLANRRSA
jgi:hypothetical protein